MQVCKAESKVVQSPTSFSSDFLKATMANISFLLRVWNQSIQTSYDFLSMLYCLDEQFRSQCKTKIYRKSQQN